MVTASLKNYRIAPRKMRLVADMIRGKGVMQAGLILAHADKKGKHPLAALLDSAIANASNNFKLDRDTLIVKEIRVDQGYVLKRSMPVSRGSAHPIKKRTSHVSITLAPAQPKAKKAKKAAK
jgi:large subunit ribosomal protein L22